MLPKSDRLNLQRVFAGDMTRCCAFKMSLFKTDNRFSLGSLVEL